MYTANDNTLPITWTIAINDWTVEGITNHPEIYFDRIDFTFNNLNATNNTQSIIVFAENSDMYLHTYYTFNKDIISSYENCKLKSCLSLTMIDNIFDNNDGILYLQIPTSYYFKMFL